MNPNYPIQVEGWRGAVRQVELEAPSPLGQVEHLVESAHRPSPLPVPAPPHSPIEKAA